MITLEELMTLENMNKAARECTKQSRWKETTQRYLSNLLINNLALRKEVLQHKYSVSPTINFSINERGHIRNIEAPVVRDRIIGKIFSQRIFIPQIRPCLIYDNYASLKMRGTSFARKRFEIMLKRYYNKYGHEGYILIIDIRKYFENVDHEVLKQLLRKRLTSLSEEVWEMIDYIIDNCSSTNKGLNLGGEPPQIFAVYYLNIIDTLIKVVLGEKYYGRYMDDSVIIARKKEELTSILNIVEETLKELHLEINKKKTRIVKLSHTFTFLQIKYNLLPSGKILKRPTRSKIVRERRRLKAFRRLLDKGQMDETEILNCYKSWRGSFVKEHNACWKTLRQMDNLFRQLFPNEIKSERKTRSVFIRRAFKEAEKEDLKQLINL